MSKTSNVDVYVKLPHGIIICGEGGFVTANDSHMAMDSARLLLEHGLNENVPRERIEGWLSRNKNLAVVRRGDVRVLDTDRLAVDSSNRK